MSVVIETKRRQVVFDPNMDANYHAYLESDEWKQLRREKILSVDCHCETCGDYTGFYGHVHHHTYENIFEEELDDLTYMCADCHLG